MGYFKKFGSRTEPIEELWSKYKRFRLSDFWDEINALLNWINPSLVLTIVLSFFWLSVLSAGLALNEYPFYAVLPLVPLQVLIGFLFFTIFHDGSHGTLSKNKSLNELMMLTSWVALLGNPWMFRKIHMRHHAYTNDPERDPDHFTASDKNWKRWAKSSVLMVYYHCYGFRMKGDLKFKLHLISSCLSPVFVFLLALCSGYFAAFFFLWLFPAWCSLALLSYANTAWPHHPAKERGRYKVAANQFVPLWLQVCMLNQNLHLLHHVKPQVPWYRYPQVFEAHQAEFEAQDAPLRVHTKRQNPSSVVPAVLKQGFQRVLESLSFPRA